MHHDYSIANNSCCIVIIICCSVLPGSPTLMSVPSITCGSNSNQVTLQWTPPTNTGGQGVMITRYSITGLPQGTNCSTGPCDMVDSTATTITGLQCNDSFIVSVRAVNCRGVGSSLQVPINLSPPGKCMKIQCIVIPILLSPQGIPSFSNTNMVNCIDNDDILLDWTVSLLLPVLITSHAQPYLYRLPLFKVTVAPVYHTFSQSLILTALVHYCSLVLMLEYLLMTVITTL